MKRENELTGELSPVVFPEWIEEHCEDLDNGWTYYNGGQADPCLIKTSAIQRTRAANWQDFWQEVDPADYITDREVVRRFLAFPFLAQACREALDERDYLSLEAIKTLENALKE